MFATACRYLSRKSWQTGHLVSLAIFASEPRQKMRVVQVSPNTHWVYCDHSDSAKAVVSKVCDFGNNGNSALPEVVEGLLEHSSLHMLTNDFKDFSRRGTG